MADALKIVMLLKVASDIIREGQLQIEDPIGKIKEGLTGPGSLPDLAESFRDADLDPLDFSGDFATALNESLPTGPEVPTGGTWPKVEGETQWEELERMNREVVEADAADPSAIAGARTMGRGFIREMQNITRSRMPDNSALTGARTMSRGFAEDIKDITRSGIPDSSRINTRPVDSHR